MVTGHKGVVKTQKVLIYRYVLALVLINIITHIVAALLKTNILILFYDITSGCPRISAV